MSKHEKVGHQKMTKGKKSKRTGASVLVATASLLGTSLGVSAAAPNGVLTDVPESAGQNSVAAKAGGQKIQFAETKVNIPPVPTVKPAIHTQGTLQTNQTKYHSNQMQPQKLQSNQKKEGPLD